MIWRIGNEESVQIWGDRKQAQFKITSLPRILDSNDTVSELIDQDTKWQNTAPVHEIFGEEEAAMICQMPLEFCT